MISLTESDVITDEDAKPLLQIFQEVHKSCQRAFGELSSKQQSISNSIEKIEFSISKLKKAKILIELFYLQLGKQLNEPSFLTRATQIELLLLSSNMHEIFLAIICKSGLDRSAAVRSLYLALLFMKNKFCEEYGNKEQINENKSFIIEINSYSDLYELIYSIDASRNELFRLWENYVKKQHLESYLCSDLEALDSTKIYKENLKEEFQNEIRKSYADNKQVGKKVELLLDTLDYLEIFFTNLMNEQRKTFFSTGVLGFKYRQYKISNPHILERIPPFILVTTEKGSIPIRLLTPDGQFTKAAEQLIVRNGTYRGS